MSEVLSYETKAVLAAEDQAYESVSDTPEYIDPTWDDSELFNLVSENANTLVKPSWMNVELPLGAAMYHIEVRRDNVSLLAAEVRQLLANREIKPEEPEEEVETDEKEIESEEEGPQQAENSEPEKEIARVKKENPPKEVKEEPESKRAIQIKEQSVTQEAETIQQYVASEHSTAAEQDEMRMDQAVVENEKQAEKEVEVSGPQEATVKAAEEAPEAVDTNAVAAEIRVAPSDTKAETLESPSGSSADVTSIDRPGVIEAPTATDGISESGRSAQKTVRFEVDQEPMSKDPVIERPVTETEAGTQVAQVETEAQQRITAFEVSDINTAADPTAETNQTEDSPELVEDQADETFILPEVVEETAIESGPAELPPPEFENMVTLSDTAELDGEELEAAEDEPALPTQEYQLNANDPANLIEEEPLLESLEAEDLELDEQGMSLDTLAQEAIEDILEPENEPLVLRADNEPSPSEQVEITSPEQQVQTSLPVEEIEDFVVQLTEQIETSEPETVEILEEILDKIAEEPTILESSEGENIIDEAQAQEELEELFTELLDNMGIDYTPEFVESLARLTLQYHLADKKIRKQKKAEADETSQDTGTHEAIQQLLVGLDLTKKALEHACAIGKSALRLSFSLAV